MTALLLTFALFTFWLLLGAGLMGLLVPHCRDLAGLLLAPALGVAVNLLPVFWLNRLGLPVGRFATPLLAFLLAGGLTLCWRKRDIGISPK